MSQNHEQAVTELRNPSSPPSRRNSKHEKHGSPSAGWSTTLQPPSQSLNAGTNRLEILDELGLDVDCVVSVTSDTGKEWDTLDNITALGLSLGDETATLDEANPRLRYTLDSPEPKNGTALQIGTPFSKWMRTIQKRTASRRQIFDNDDSVVGTERSLTSAAAQELSKSHHKKSSSGSSLGFVTAVKSASLSLASFSIATHSMRRSESFRCVHVDRGCKASAYGTRRSEDTSHNTHTVVIDERVIHRSLQRRRVLEEIISTEENYVADIRFLMNASMACPLSAQCY